MRFTRTVFVALLASATVYACGSSHNNRRPDRGDAGPDGAAPEGSGTGGRTGTGGAASDGGDTASGGTDAGAGGSAATGGAESDANVDASSGGRGAVDVPDAPVLGEFCVFPDPNLEDYVRGALGSLPIDGGVPDGPIPVSLAARLTSIDFFCDCDTVFDFRGVECLTGLEDITLAGEYEHVAAFAYTPALKTVRFRYMSELPAGFDQLTQVQVLDFTFSNHVSDITPLARLTNLTELDAAGNEIADLTPLAKLTKLRVLQLGVNKLTTLAPLSKLASLEELSFSGNQITDLSPLAGLTSLVTLDAGGNAFTDLSALQGLTNLSTLTLYSDAHITNLSPLVNNSGFGDGDSLFVSLHNEDCASFKDDLSTLTSRGVSVSVLPSCVNP